MRRSDQTHATPLTRVLYKWSSTFVLLKPVLTSEQQSDIGPAIVSRRVRHDRAVQCGLRSVRRWSRGGSRAGTFTNQLTFSTFLAQQGISERLSSIESHLEHLRFMDRERSKVLMDLIRTHKSNSGESRRRDTNSTLGALSKRLTILKLTSGLSINVSRVERVECNQLD
ncbi:unnamed protein product [Sphagnum balticum]